MHGNSNIKIAGTLHEHVCAVFVISCSNLVRMRTVSEFIDKMKKKISILFPKIMTFLSTTLHGVLSQKTFL